MQIPDQAKDAVIDRIVLQMGINVDDGFIYFNEMLYRIMRAQFVTAKNLKFNKVLTVSELVTQFKLAEQTLIAKAAKGINKAQREAAFFE